MGEVGVKSKTGRPTDGSTEIAGHCATKRFKKDSGTSLSGLPDDMLCCICYNARKSVLIQTCKHLVFCAKCDREFKLKNFMFQECPICRKEFKKTIQVLFS